MTVTIPEISTEFELGAETAADSVEIRDGHLFEPYYLMRLNYTVTADTKEVRSWLQIRKTKA